MKLRKGLTNMKKSNVILGIAVGAAAGYAYAVWKKMQEPQWNKQSIKGHAEEFAGHALHNDDLAREGKMDQVIGASRAVANDITKQTSQIIDDVIGTGTSMMVKGKLDEVEGKHSGDKILKTKGKVEEVVGATQFTKEKIDNHLEKKHEAHQDNK